MLRSDFIISPRKNGIRVTIILARVTSTVWKTYRFQWGFYKDRKLFLIRVKRNLINFDLHGMDICHKISPYCSREFPGSVSFQQL